MRNSQLLHKDARTILDFDSRFRTNDRGGHVYTGVGRVEGDGHISIKSSSNERECEKVTLIRQR